MRLSRPRGPAGARLARGHTSWHKEVVPPAFDSHVKALQRKEVVPRAFDSHVKALQRSSANEMGRLAVLARDVWPRRPGAWGKGTAAAAASRAAAKSEVGDAFRVGSASSSDLSSFVMSSRSGVQLGVISAHDAELNAR